MTCQPRKRKEVAMLQKIELRTHFDQASGKNLQDVLPGGAVAVVDSQHAVRVEQVQHIDTRLQSVGPLELKGASESQVELAETFLVDGSRRVELRRDGFTASGRSAACREVAAQRRPDVRVGSDEAGRAGNHRNVLIDHAGLHVERQRIHDKKLGLAEPADHGGVTLQNPGWGGASTVRQLSVTV